MIMRCMWCGTLSNLDDLDLNERNEPAYCPECGHGDFDIRNVDPSQYCLEERSDDE